MQGRRGYRGPPRGLGAAGGSYAGANFNAGYGMVGPGYQPQAMPGGSDQPQIVEDFFVYSLSIPSLDAGATSNQNIAIQADSDFEWMMTTCAGMLTGTTEPWSDAIQIPITVLVTDGGSGRQLLNQAVPITGIAGTGRQPFIMPISRIFEAKSTVNFTFTSFSGATWIDIYFNLIGKKRFASS